MVSLKARVPLFSLVVAHSRMSLECCEYHIFNLRAIEFRVEKPAYEKSAPRRFEFSIQLAVC